MNVKLESGSTSYWIDLMEEENESKRKQVEIQLRITRISSQSFIQKKELYKMISTHSSVLLFVSALSSQKKVEISLIFMNRLQVAGLDAFKVVQWICDFGLTSHFLELKAQSATRRAESNRIPS